MKLLLKLLSNLLSGSKMRTNRMMGIGPVMKLPLLMIILLWRLLVHCHPTQQSYQNHLNDPQFSLKLHNPWSISLHPAEQAMQDFQLQNLSRLKERTLLGKSIFLNLSLEEFLRHLLVNGLNLLLRLLRVSEACFGVEKKVISLR